MPDTLDYKALARELEELAQARAAYDTLSRFLNGRNSAALVQVVAEDHRTLQQCFTKLCVAWLEHLAKLPEGHYDLRNDASVRLARKVTATREWEDCSRLPYI